MQRIYKYKLKHTNLQELEVPENHKVITAQYDQKTNKLCLWVMVEPDKPFDTFLTIEIVGTGEMITTGKKERNYINTVQQDGYVWHIFELK